jgi:hypothetical protein
LGVPGAGLVPKRKKAGHRPYKPGGKAWQREFDAWAAKQPFSVILGRVGGDLSLAREHWRQIHGVYPKDDEQ